MTSEKEKLYRISIRKFLGLLSILDINEYEDIQDMKRFLSYEWDDCLRSAYKALRKGGLI